MPIGLRSLHRWLALMVVAMATASSFVLSEQAHAVGGQHFASFEPAECVLIAPERRAKRSSAGVDAVSDYAETALHGLGALAPARSTDTTGRPIRDVCKTPSRRSFRREARGPPLLAG